MNYDSYYEDYAASRSIGDFGQMSSIRFVLPYLINRKVLDIGCSDGLYLSMFGDGSVGIEQVPSLVKASRDKGLTVLEGDVFANLKQLPDNSFDSVLFSHVMEHVDAPIVALREINRVLDFGGFLILGLPTERNIFRILLRMDYFNGTHIYAFSIRNATKLLEDTGFVIKEPVYYHLPRCRGPIGNKIEAIWNKVSFPLREQFSMAYWIVAQKTAMSR